MRRIGFTARLFGTWSITAVADQAAKLPIWIVAPDYQVKKHGMSAKAILAEVKINDGLHLNEIMLMRIDTRLRVTLSMHFDPKGQYYQEYVHDGHPLRRIHVEPVRKTPNVIADYTLKSLKWRIPDLDNVLIFPKTLSELPKLHSGEKPNLRDLDLLPTPNPSLLPLRQKSGL